MALQIAKRLIRSGAARNPTVGLFSSFDRNYSSSPGLIRATLFPGDGIGPEIAESVKQVRFVCLLLFYLLIVLLLLYNLSFIICYFVHLFEFYVICKLVNC